MGATRAGASEFIACRSCWRQGSSGRDARSRNVGRLISLASNSPCSNAKLTPCDVRSTMSSLLSAPIRSRVAACPVGEFRERAAELAFQPSDVGAVADALEPFEHQRHILAVLPDLFDWRLRESNRPTQRLRQDFRRLRHRSYVTGEIDLAAVQGGGIGERARAEPANVVHRNHL